MTDGNCRSDTHAVRLRAFTAGALLLATACATAGTAPGAYQVATHTEAPPPLAAPPAATVQSQKPTAATPPGLSPSQASIIGIPSVLVSVKTSSDGDDLASVISNVARQANLNAVIDPAVH